MRNLNIQLWIRFGIKSNVTYWPLTKSSIKRFTCVKKWKNSGSRWALNNNIARRTDGLSQLELEPVGDKMPNWEPAADRGLWALSDPQLSNPTRWERSAAMVRRTGVNIEVYPCLHSPLTYKKHHPFENKVWEIHFYKEVFSFVHWSSSLCLIMFRIYLYMYMYAAIQHQQYKKKGK